MLKRRLSETPGRFVMMLFGAVGCLMRKFGYEPAPLMLAFVLRRMAIALDA